MSNQIQNPNAQNEYNLEEIKNNLKFDLWH